MNLDANPKGHPELILQSQGLQPIDHIDVR